MRTQERNYDLLKDIPQTLTVDNFNYYRERGYSQADIARIFNVTAARVSQVKNESAKSYATPRELAMKKFPWNAKGFAQTYLYRVLKDHAVFMASDKDELSKDELALLERFYRKLKRENLVVEFDPRITEDETGMAGGGFAYRPQQDSDRQYFIIRVNEYTNLERDVEAVWTLPPEYRD